MSTEIELLLPPQYHEGALGVIVPNRTAALGIKLFKRERAEQITFSGRPWENELRREAFLSEVEAYEASMSSSDLRRIVPEFLGRRTVKRVRDASGKDVSDRFLLNCCFEMAWVEKRFVKLCSSGIPVVSLEEYRRVVRMFERVGVRYITDASVAIDGQSGAIVSIVDFATCDAYQEAELRRLP